MFTTIESGFAEQTIHQSRFYAYTTQVDAEQKAATFLRAVAAQHKNAHHLAYAFRIKTVDGIIARFSDANEPSGTAGKPILQMLEVQKLINVCIGVIRYYGGINLGTGGLARAYCGTAKMALHKVQLIAYVEMQQITITTSYKRFDELSRALSKINGEILHKTFDEAAHFVVKLPISESQQFLQRFNTV